MGRDMVPNRSEVVSSFPLLAMAKHSSNMANMAQHTINLAQDLIMVQPWSQVGAMVELY